MTQIVLEFDAGAMSALRKGPSQLAEEVKTAPSCSGTPRDVFPKARAPRSWASAAPPFWTSCIVAESRGASGY